MAGVVGRSSRKSDKLWRDALMVAIKRTDEGDHRTLLARAAEECARAAANGDLAAMKEIGDRIDGKPAQQLNIGDGEDGPMTLVIKRFTPEPSGT